MTLPEKQFRIRVGRGAAKFTPVGLLIMYYLLHSMSLGRIRWLHPVLGLFCALVVIPNPALSADQVKRTFALPAEDAEKSLKRFSEQSGRGLIVDTDMVKDVRTKAVRGEFTVREALDRMLAGTGLIAAQDESSGAFTVRRGNANRNAEGAMPIKGARPLKKKLKIPHFPPLP